MSEEKELTIEEMKSLVSLATLLPALLEKIAAINKDVAELKTSFIDIKSKYNNNTAAVIAYKESVDALINNKLDADSIGDRLKAIEETLNKIESGMTIKPSPSEPIIKEEPAPKPAKTVKPRDPDQDKIEEIVDKILEARGGRKTRVLTDVNIKKGFNVDDALAEKVLKWFENHKMYNPKLHMLTFPKG